MLILIIALAAVLLILGFEMFLVLGIPALATKEAFYGNIPDAAVVQKIFGGIDHTTLLAIPFFIFAAHLMGSGQIAKNLTGFVRSLVGHTRGGMGHTVIGGSMAFGSVSGSAPATVAAMGKMVYPEMRKNGFSEKFSLGLLVASAETALLIPPSITFIIYGWMTGTSIAKLFAGGLAVGLFLGLAFAIMVWIEAKRHGIEPDEKTTWGQRLASLREAKWALGMPFIILGGIYSGTITPTEAAAVSVVYAIFVEMVVYRNDAGPIQFLLAVNVCFLIAGMFIDPNSALLILVPPLFPVAQAMGVDPIHFGMIVTLNISLGMITPPFGLDIFVASSTLNKPVLNIIKGVWPFVLVNILVLLVVTYVPQISLFIPQLIFG